MFEEALKDNPLLSYLIGFLILSAVVAIIRWIVIFYRMGVDTASKTQFIKAADKGSIDECIRLIDMGTDINQTTKLGNTALMMACGSGQFETVKLLISKGADINRLGDDNRTALMNAIFYNKESTNKIVDFLIEKGANINLVDKKYATALAYSVAYNNYGAFDLLLKKGAVIDESSLITAVKKNREEMLNKLIEHGGDVNKLLAGSNRSLLRIAVEEMNEKMVKLLLEKGADINLKDSNGVSAKDYGTNFTYSNKTIKKLLQEVAEKLELSGGGKDLVSNEWECSECKAVVREEDKICPKCGANLE